MVIYTLSSRVHLVLLYQTHPMPIRSHLWRKPVHICHPLTLSTRYDLLCELLMWVSILLFEIILLTWILVGWRDCYTRTSWQWSRKSAGKFIQRWKRWHYEANMLRHVVWRSQLYPRGLVQQAWKESCPNICQSIRQKEGIRWQATLSESSILLAQAQCTWSFETSRYSSSNHPTTTRKPVWRHTIAGRWPRLLIQYKNDWLCF